MREMVRRTDATMQRMHSIWSGLNKKKNVFSVKLFCENAGGANFSILKDYDLKKQR